MLETKSRISSIFILIEFIIFSLFLLAQNVAAQEITIGNDFGVGARAMGMGGAFIGVSDDYTALYWNPAGLSQIKWMEFFGGLSYEKMKSETEYFGNSDSTFSSDTRPNAFGLVLSVPVVRGGLAFAFGVNRLQSFDSRISFQGFNTLSVKEDPLYGELYVDRLETRSGGINSYSFGAAVDIAPGVSIGGNIGFLSGRYEYELNLDADDTENNELLDGFSFLDTISSDYFGVESKVGLLARFGELLRFGATINIPFDFSVDEYWTEDTYISDDDGQNESSGDEGTFGYDISRPFRFSVGLSVMPISTLILSADVAYTDWTQTEYSDPPAEDIDDNYFIDNYSGTYQLRVGGEYTIPDVGLRLRGGYILDPKPYTPDYVNIDSDRKFITLGIGMLMEEVISLDLAYVRGTYSESSDDGTIKEKKTTNRVFMSANYRF